jgi:hypothetical protein
MTFVGGNLDTFDMVDYDAEAFAGMRRCRRKLVFVCPRVQVWF